MKTLGRRTLAIILSVMMVLSCFAGMAFSVGADDVSDMKKTISSMSVGDTFTYGSYPQTDVTSELGSELTAAAPPTGEWTSYNYYYDGEQSDYMKYYDLSYNGSRYRGVYFTKYRPYDWDSTSSGIQSENGYSTNNVYWFRYDPLTWRILDPSTGYVICEDVIDSQAFNNEYYENGTEDAYGDTAYYNDKTYTHLANNWEYSTIRTWLNELFFITAFSASERSQIPCTKLTTPAYSMEYSEYDVGETGDYVFLPSYQDMLNSSYGFSDYMNCRTHSSDYAKSQGVNVDIYLLRSASFKSVLTTFVSDEGIGNYWNTGLTYIGIRPALCFNPSSTANPTEKTTVPSTEKPTEKPSEIPTEPTTKAEEKLEFADNANVDGKIDEKNKKVSIVPSASMGMSLDDFKAMFKGAVSIAGEKIEKVFNGMKFMFNGNEYTFILKGDTSPDGKITAKDARTILRIAARLEQPDDVTKESADIDSDRKVTSKEARSVLRFAAKLQNKIYG